MITCNDGEHENSLQHRQTSKHEAPGRCTDYLRLPVLDGAITFATGQKKSTQNSLESQSLLSLFHNDRKTVVHICILYKFISELLQRSCHKRVKN